MWIGEGAYRSHIRDRESRITGEIPQSWPRELDDSVRSNRVPFQLLQDVQDDVLAADARTGSTDETDVDAFGDFEPRLACDERHGHVCRAEADGQTAQSAGGAGVRVGADDEHAWLCPFAVKFGVHDCILSTSVSSSRRSLEGGTRMIHSCPDTPSF